MPISDEHVNLLKRQGDLITRLKTIIASQQQALEQLGVADAHESQQTADADGYDSGCEADHKSLADAATRSLERVRHAPISDEEKKEANIDWSEPSEEEERNFMATKPWLGAMAMPDGFEFGKTDGMPDVTLELDHIYGYRAKACRNNIAWVDEETIVFPAAGVGVVHNIRTRKQIFCREHTDDIVSLAYHPTRRIVATGELGKTPAIVVWDVTTGQPLSVLKGFHRRAVVSVSFSADGSKIASVGLDDDHSIAVYDWAAGSLLATSKGDTNRILDIQNNTSKDADPQSEWVTVGVKHTYFWTLDGGSLSSKRGLLGRMGEYKTFMTVGFTTLYTVVGTSDGEMYLYEKNKLTKVIDAHQKHLYSLKGTGGDTLYSGGSDGFVCKWNMNSLKKEASVNLNKFEAADVMANTTNAVRAIDFRENDGRILVGTQTSSIYTVNLNSSSVECCISGHYDAPKTNGELWGIAAHPTKAYFVTAGDDSSVRVWDVEERRVLHRFQLKEPALCVAWCPDASQIAVGLQNGAVQVLNYDSRNGFDEYKLVRRHNKRVQCIQYSPCGKYLAAGSADNTVSLYDVERSYRTMGMCRGNNSVILHVDFSADSKYIQTCSQSYELLFYEVADQNQYTKSRDLKNEKWATFTSILGWDVQGIWPKDSDGSDVNSVAKSRGERYLATVEDTGLVKVFNYPCVGGGLDRRGSLVRRPNSHQAKGHSSHVTNVAWGVGDKYLFTSGGGDLCAFQWKVVQQA
eukprot:PhM_4_TR8339/c5_g1_i1/m.73333